MSIESNNWVATEQDIAELADRHIIALNTSRDCQDIYIRALWGTSLKELGLEAPRKARGGRISTEETARQLAGVKAVHERFYAVVLKRIDANLPATLRGEARAREMNRRSNTWRTALYAIRLYLRSSGKGLESFHPSRVTKSALHSTVAAQTPRPMTPRRLRNRVERFSKRFVAAVLELGETDRETAVRELDTLLGQLTAQRIELGGAPVKDARVAASEHRPLRVGGTVFMPTMTQVVRQMSQPS